MGTIHVENVEKRWKMSSSTYIRMWRSLYLPRPHLPHSQILLGFGFLNSTWQFLHSHKLIVGSKGIWSVLALTWPMKTYGFSLFSPNCTITLSWEKGHSFIISGYSNIVMQLFMESRWLHTTCTGYFNPYLILVWSSLTLPYNSPWLSKTYIRLIEGLKPVWLTQIRSWIEQEVNRIQWLWLIVKVPSYSALNHDQSYLHCLT